MGVSCFNVGGGGGGGVFRWGWGFIFKREGAPWGAFVLVRACVRVYVGGGGGGMGVQKNGKMAPPLWETLILGGNFGI